MNEFRITDQQIELAVYLKHDANITIFSEEKMILYVEMEKVTQNRYQSFSLDKEMFRKQWLEWVTPYISGYSFHTIHWNWATDDQLTILKELFPYCKNWIQHTHHISHAWSLYNYTQPKEGDLIISVDGRGDLGDSFNIYEFRNNDIQLVREVNLRLGVGYRMLGILSPEIDSDRTFEFDRNHSVPGKAMALAGYGKFRNEWADSIRDYYIHFREFSHPSKNIEKLKREVGISGLPVERDIGRDLIATSQKVFEDLYLENVSDLIELSNTKRILLTGGCALNVTLNSILSTRFNKEIFVSPVPGDCGISLGMFRAARPISPLISVYQGISFIDQKTYETNDISIANTDIKSLANHLASGKVIGVIYGNCEMGPRALGQRSLLASPFIPGMKDKLNRIKRREFYRPVSPIIPLALINEFFINPVASPYMSFAPKVRPEYKKLLEEVTHVDGTARLQTVHEFDNFIFELLKAFGEFAPYPILVNTSLNLKGKPLVNDSESALRLLQETGIDCLWINGILYEK